MVFDIEEIGEEGLSFEFEADIDQLDIEQEDCSLNKIVEVRGRLTRVGDNVYLKGDVNTELALKCSRCLDRFIQPVSSKFKARFMPFENKTDSHRELELQDSDIDVECYVGHRVDLTQSIRDEILLTVPVVCLCVDDCMGICPQCGIRLNEGSCECTNDLTLDPRLEVLKKLKNKIK